MKTLLSIFVCIMLLSCLDQPVSRNNSLIGMEFKHYKEIDLLAAYDKEIDTSIFENNMFSKHGILQLENLEGTLVIFKSTSYDTLENKIHRIIDTLAIDHLNQNEVVTVGYCQVDDNNDENLIAVVVKADGWKIETVKKVWRANTKSNRIEVVDDISHISCINQYYGR